MHQMRSLSLLPVKEISGLEAHWPGSMEVCRMVKLPEPD